MKNTTDDMQDQEKGYESLAAAILQLAMRDYKNAIKKNDFHKMLDLERFFLGELGQTLSYGNGANIIERCRKEVNSSVPFIKTKLN